MDDRSAATPGARREFRPVGWREAPLWRNLRRDVLTAALISAGPLLQAFSPTYSGTITAWFILAGTALLLLASVLGSVGASLERVVVTPDAVEVYRWRRTRPRARVTRVEQLWASRFHPRSFFGQPFGPRALAMSDGRNGLVLTSDSWVHRHDELVTALGISAQYVDAAVAVRRHPEAFPWSVRQSRPVRILIGLLWLAGIVTLVIVLR